MKTTIIDERLFYCEPCQGYALVQKDNWGKIIVSPCACEEESN